MQQSSPSLGTLSTFSTEVHVVREGQENILFQGEALREGDVIINKSDQPMEFELPARSPEQGLTKMILPAGAQATLGTMTTAEGTPITQISSPQFASIELIVEGDGESVAEVTDGSEGAMSGLVGAGLLAGGGSLLAGSAALVGGAALVAGSDSNDDPNGGDSLSSQNGNSTTAPPEQVNGIEGVIAEVSDALEDTPLEPVGGALDPVQDAVGTVSDALNGVAESDPTGVTGVVTGLLGGQAQDSSDDTSSGLVGIVEEVVDGLSEGTADTPAGAVTTPLAEALDQPLTLIDTVLSTQAEALDVVATNDPTGVTTLVQNLLGGTEALATETAENLLPDAGQTSGLQGALAEVSDVLATGPLAPVNTIVDPLQGGLNVLGDTLETVTPMDPTGVTGVVSGLVGATSEVDLSASNGLVGVVSEVTEGLAQETANTPLNAVTAPVATAVDTVSQPLDSTLTTVADALDPVAAADPSGLVGTVQTLLGSDNVEASQSSLPGAEIFDGLLASGGDIPVLGGLLEGSTGSDLPLIGDLPVLGDVLASTSNPADTGLPLTGDLPVVGDLLAVADTDAGSLPLSGDLPLIGDLLGSVSTDTAGSDLPLAGDLPLLGDLLNGITSNADLTALDTSGVGLLTGALA